MRHFVAVRPIFGILLTALAWLITSPVQAAHTHPALLLGSDAARPGDTVLAGIKLDMDPGWHTYWKNPGGPGIATKIDWELPPGITAGEIRWPIPEKLPDQEFTTYIYKDAVVLLVPLKIGPQVSPGRLQIKAAVSWLECDVSCIPGDGHVEATLTVGSENVPSKDAALLASWEKRMPVQGNPFSARALWEKATQTNARPLIIEWKAGREVSDPDFFPYGSDDFEMLGATERLPAGPGLVRIRKTVTKTSADWPKSVPGVLVQHSGDVTNGCEVTLPTSGDMRISAAAPSASEPPKTIWHWLLYAFLGGLILNIMPCVLPVLALKVLGFVSQGKDNPGRARTLGLVYGFGVVVSFLALAGMVIALKAAGHRAGWGFQFGNPFFLIAMTTLVTLIALNLFGVFEVHLGGRTMDTAARLSSKHGAAGAFFNGLLATLLATSCTAPFLGAAIGFAFAEPAPVILLILGTVGLGLAAPYVLLSLQPGWLEFLPKPGAWMERFKIAMGFPMLAAAVWLFSLTSAHYGERSLWLAIFLVMLALAAWIYGEFVQRHRVFRGLAWAAVVLTLASAYGFVLESRMRWRNPANQASVSTPENDPNGIHWERWSQAAVQKARAGGHPVLVDFTARWCLTCNTIVKPALESQSVRNKVREFNAATLLGDYTAFPPEITDELNHYQRAGVPLVLVFPANPEAPAIVLPEALTPGMIVNALERAAR
jgi:thiol:disulfide interchange protein/DsbC/DsbD-like thiol-disulfide interchange protein